MPISLSPEIYPVTHEITNELGSISLVGQCLATPSEFEAVANRALSEREIRLVSDLPGGYAAVMTYGKAQDIAADLAGRFRFCWQQTEEGLQVSLDDHVFEGPTNLAYLGSHILELPGLVSGQTAVTGVQRLTGGQAAHFENDNLVSLTGTDMPSDPSVGIEEAARELRRTLTEAVERRVMLGKLMTSDFSGGFDSTTLALLAADDLPQGMDAFVNFRSGLPVGDVSFARQIAATHPNIRLHLQRQGQEELPFWNMGRQPIPGVSPDPLTICSAQIDSHLSTLQGFNSELHMTGEGGDGVLSPPPNFVTDLARQKDWDRLRQFAQARGRLTHVSPDQIYEKAVYDAARLPADDFRDLAAKLRNPRDLREDHQASRYSWFAFPEQNIAFLTAPLRRQLAELAEQRADNQPLSDIANTLGLQELRSGGNTQHYLQYRAAAFGIEAHAPFLDGRVIQAALQAPAYARSSPGAFKYILHRAFSDYLPPELLARTSKSAYSGEFYRGLRTSWNDILGLFAKNCHLAELNIIEPGAVIQELHKLDTGQRGLLLGIERAITAELWLRHREAVYGTY